MTEFLKAWKARLIAVAAALAGLLQLLQPQWLIDIFGPNSSGWVNVTLVVGAFLLNQLLNSNPANAVEKDA